MRESIIGSKTFNFAVKIVDLYKELIDTKKEYVLSKQMLKAGTSIGANVREALEAQSKKDFIAKLFIALKEAVETEYWIDFLAETEYIEKEVYKTKSLQNVEGLKDGFNRNYQLSSRQLSTYIFGGVLVSTGLLRLG